MHDDKYVGLALAIASTGAIGSSFVITKKGLLQAEQRHGFEGEGFVYLKNPLWWAGIATLGIGEVCNFAAYAFAPAVLVTPLGALSVLVSAVLGSYFLKEELGTLGRLSIAICLIGAVIIVLHAPPDQEIETVDQILHYALQPGFLIYAVAAATFTVFMIYKIAPVYGKKNALVYLSICSTVGSISVMSVKAFGIALKLTFQGNNQFTHPSTYVFIILTTVCILTQTNYLNKALACFPTNIVNPQYYVTFTTATLCASFILFGGFNTTNTVNTLSLLCGFLTTFIGVYLLNLSSHDPHKHGVLVGVGVADGTGTHMDFGLQTRHSVQSYRSSASIRYSLGSIPGDRRGLMRAYDEEEATEFGLTDRAQDSNGKMNDIAQPRNVNEKKADVSNDEIEIESGKPDRKLKPT